MPRFLSKRRSALETEAFMLSISHPASAQADDYLDEALPLETRVEDLLARLTFEEKLALTHADSKFTSPGIPRLGIGPLWLSDGPHGVREQIGPHSWASAGSTDDFATYLPVLTTLAASWNPELATLHGEVLADEALKRGKHVLLGPGVNIQRSPLNGRNFEYMGEDPYLVSRLAVGVIRGMQSRPVAANAKHFALNNQEWQRDNVDVVVSERALREIYLPAFEASVKEGGVLTFMGAYNRYLGQHCCHSERLVNDILKGEWGFQGVYLSDWNGVRDTREAALFGMDLEMGTVVDSYDDYFLARPYAEGLASGLYPMETLDDKVRRNLRLMFATKVIGERPPGSINTKAHQDASARIADEGIVLLRNERDALPLDDSRVHRIAVIGDAAIHKFASGGWSSGVKAFYEVTALEGLTNRVGAKSDLSFSVGYVVPGRLVGGVADGAGVLRGATELTAEVDPQELVARAETAARQADVALVFATLSHAKHQDTEGSDRLELRLPWGQNELIARVAAANPRTIVVLYAGSPVEMPWLGQVAAVLHAWYPGMEGGNAIARILFGDVNPSAKLPCSFPQKLADSPAHHSGLARHWPGEATDQGYYQVHYDEGLLVGYRWHDARHIAPLFPFGHGLSYTQFSYANPSLSETPEGVSILCDITNTGSRFGQEIVQVYVADRVASVERPPQELKGFAKIALAPGETRSVSIKLDRRAFAFWDVELSAWLAEAGDFELRIGASSRDIRLTLPYRLPDTAIVE